jgi:hypothetical protein
MGKKTIRKNPMGFRRFSQEDQRPSGPFEVAQRLLGPRLSFDWTSDEERELEVVPDKAGCWAHGAGGSGG